MLIDWFTVVAQIINFLILVVLLKYLLYDRIIRAMDAREEKMQERMKKAENKEKEAEEEAEKHRREKEDFERKRKEMLSQVEEEAEEKRKEWSRKAREEVEGTRQKWQQSLERDQSAFLRELRQLAAREVYGISRRVLRELADQDIEKRMVDIFVSRIENLAEEKKKEIAAAIREEKKVTVQSAFEIPPNLRRKITRTIHEETGADGEISYRTDSDMMMGVELLIGGLKVSWSLENYLEALERKAEEVLAKEKGKVDQRQGKDEEDKEKEGGKTAGDRKEERRSNG